MLTRLSNWLRQRSTGRIALLALVVFVAFMAVEFSGGETLSEDPVFSVGVPDVSFYYTAERLYEMAESYGEQGRARYIESARTFDLWWPLVYTFFLATSLSWLTRRLFAEGSLWQRANLVPIIGMLLDYAENISVATVMGRYPEPTPILASLAGILTVLKWLFVGGAVLLVLALAILLLWRGVTRRTSS